jgi:glutamate synthase domain-containing protein 2
VDFTTIQAKAVYHHIISRWRCGLEYWNGYFSTRTEDGKFSMKNLQKATLDNVKMIEIKFSQGAKPGHGGILPKK